MSDVPSVPARPVLTGETERFVSLREFEQRMFALQQQMTEQIRAQRELVETRAEALDHAQSANRDLVDARADALDKALTLRTTEIARRLEELNHAHKNAQENWRQSLPREVFEATLSEWSKWRDTVNIHVTTMSPVPSQISALDGKVNVAGVHVNALTGMPPHMATLESRIKSMENSANQIVGALTLIRFMGFAGVIALLLTFARMAKMLP